MALLRMAALGAAGYGLYKYMTGEKRNHAAFAKGENTDDNFAQFRSSGPAAMAGGKNAEWDATDESSDQSFPASDPPSTY
ncbi:hypothetical protein PK98_13225 [Croceibacterium mercuriale]|uniref:Uncharacterized protein n=1 Tax=Croceibacterium mercuriale TaxID=1572751 RepID=A0A0B2BXW2_9SPHN|nr:hypothetical protein [Croceibacterium mercuriale]KHL24842.1 hypothetical protein PK98_13225 [Croceibacterium mercuriale]